MFIVDICYVRIDVWSTLDTPCYCFEELLLLALLFGHYTRIILLSRFDTHSIGHEKT